MQKTKRHFWAILATLSVITFAAIQMQHVSLADESNAAASALDTWTLTTPDTKLTIGIGKDRRLYIYELSNPKAGWNWTRSASPFPLMNRIDVGGKQVAPHWFYQDAEVDATNGRKVTLRFTSDNPAMELKSVWHARPGRGPIQHAMLLTNKAGRQVTIYNQESLDLHVVGPNVPTDVFYINDDALFSEKGGVFSDRVTPTYAKDLDITSHNQDWIPYVVVNSNNTCGVYIGWEWSNGRIAVSSDKTSHGVVLKAGIGGNFRTDVSAGETFEVPAGFVGAYAGDLDDCGNSVRRYLFQYNMPEMIRKDPTFPKVQWNAFAPTGKGQGNWDPTEKKYYPFIDDIAPLGYEEVVIDVGWWSSYGKPTPGHIVTDSVDWPKGMAAAADYAHEHGIRLGLYYNEPPDFTSETGKQQRLQDINYLLHELKADFYRSDSTAGPVIQGGIGKDHRAHYPEDMLYWATRGFYEVLDALYAENPTFLWENCSCGGAIKDFGAAKRSCRIQNQDRYYPINARQSFWDASYVFPPMQLAALDGSWADWQAAGSVYEFRSSSMGAAYWHPDAPNGGNGGPVWSTRQKEEIKKAVATYKTRIRPLIRNADLYHIFPRPDDKRWDGIEYYDPATGKGVVYLFKAAKGNDTNDVKFRGVEPNARYRLTFEDGSNPSTEKTGKELIDGVPVTLVGELQSELLFFEKL